jgi:hypothetical protein
MDQYNSRKPKNSKGKTTADLLRACFTHCDYCGKPIGPNTDFQILGYADDGRGKPIYTIHVPCVRELERIWRRRAA